MEELQIKIIETFARLETDRNLFQDLLKNLSTIQESDFKDVTKNKKIKKEKSRMNLFKQSMKAYFDLIDGMELGFEKTQADIDKTKESLNKARHFMKRLRWCCNRLSEANIATTKRERKEIKVELEALKEYMEKHLL